MMIIILDIYFYQDMGCLFQTFLKKFPEGMY